MKKLVALILLSFVFQLNAYADGPDDARKAHREEMKKIKAEMKAARPKTAEPSKMSDFWKKEGERSGMSQWNASKAGDFFKNLNPAPFFQEQDKKYKERKAALTK